MEFERFEGKNKGDRGYLNQAIGIKTTKNRISRFFYYSKLMNKLNLGISDPNSELYVEYYYNSNEKTIGFRFSTNKTEHSYPLGEYGHISPSSVCSAFINLYKINIGIDKVVAFEAVYDEEFSGYYIDLNRPIVK